MVSFKKILIILSITFGKKVCLLWAVTFFIHYFVFVCHRIKKMDKIVGDINKKHNLPRFIYFCEILLTNDLSTSADIINKFKMTIISIIISYFSSIRLILFLLYTIIS